MDNIHLLRADLLVAAKLAVSDNPSAPIRVLEDELPGMSRSAIAVSLKRLQKLELVKVDGKRRRVNRQELRACFEHAVRWLAPARPGDFELGLPTAHSSETISCKLAGDDDPVVMPLAHGPKRGRAVAPIHPGAPRAAARDPKLHKLLAVIDSFRIGGAREREVARGELEGCF